MGSDSAYASIVLKRPVAVLATIGVVVGTLGWFGQQFALDASAESLTLERDEALHYYRSIRKQYGSDDYLIVAFSAKQDLFQEDSLNTIARLTDELSALSGVESVVSLLDVPLLNSPSVPLREIGVGVRRLRESDTSRVLAREELTTSPLYRDLVVSADGQTAAIQINFFEDTELLSLRDRRDTLRAGHFEGTLSTAELTKLAEVSSAFEQRNRQRLLKEANNIEAVRSILKRYEGLGDLHLGGVPMIVADSIKFIRHDLVVFGVAVLTFLVIILTAAFQKLRWVMLPLITCLATCVSMAGFLGLVRWPVTVVSSNFLSLLLILCLALTVHIIVRYREVHWLNPQWDQYRLVQETVRRIVVPCLYTAITTMVAFGSLIVSGIRPVIDFGWMMVIGIAFAFVYSFTLFPAALMLLTPGEPSERRDATAKITQAFANWIQRRHRLTLIISLVVAVVSAAGAARLTVENRFIDYYRQSTEIHQGMELIDKELGGTTPLDIIIDAPQGSPFVEPTSTETESDDDFDDDDPFAEFEALDEDLAGEAGITAESYWFNSRHLGEVVAIHDYLDALPETGKVISLATIAKVLGQLDPPVLQDDLYLSVVYERMPPDVLDALITPYLSDDGQQLRFSLRVFESDPSLRRSALLERIQTDLVQDFGFSADQVHLSGMLVLYNNMLQSLFRSQILTLGAVFLAILLMFFMLFRSARIAIAAIIPNVSSAALVLGLMGWLGIPLDLMTITIAAITIGIAVDDTIHYVHRFRVEFEKDGAYWPTIGRCHRSIGRAMYYTSVTILLGFSVLVLSQFVPTVYFGLLTGLAMIAALLANMTLLPALLVVFKAGGRPAVEPPIA